MSTIRIGDWEFDWQDYDAEHDVLYLSAGEPRAGYGRETPEGHFLRFDNDDEFYGVTLMGVRRSIDREGVVRITGLPRRLPRSEEISGRDLEPVF